MRATGVADDETKPFPTIHAAVAALRQYNRGSAQAYILLREGTHALTETLELTPKDSHITFAPYPGQCDNSVLCLLPPPL